jgi:beta-lactamase superfamily II metal-dependent hydrolase
MEAIFVARRPHHNAKRPAIAVFAALVVLVFSSLSPVLAEFIPSGQLEIHYVNVGQGGATLIIGPDGTRIFFDFGAVPGKRDIVPYLRDVVGLPPQDGLHYTVVSHGDKDHYLGYRDVVENGYDVRVANYGSGSPKRSPITTSNWLEPAEDHGGGCGPHPRRHAYPAGTRR